MAQRTLVLEQTLYFYDEPVLFTGRIDGGDLWAFTLARHVDADAIYHGAPTTQATVDAVDANTLPVSALFLAHAPVCDVRLRHPDTREEDVFGTIVELTVCADQDKAAKGCVPDPKVFLHL